MQLFSNKDGAISITVPMTKLKMKRGKTATLINTMSRGELGSGSSKTESRRVTNFYDTSFNEKQHHRISQSAETNRASNEEGQKS